MYGDKPAKQLKRSDIAQAIDEVINYIGAHPDDNLLPYDYIHFQKQYTYVYDRGERLVSCLYSVDQLEKLVADISTFIGEDIAEPDGRGMPREQAGVVYRYEVFKYGLSPRLAFMDRLAHRVAKSRLKPLLHKLLYTPSQTRHEDLFGTERVQDFIKTYYAEDIDIYNRVTESLGIQEKSGTQVSI